jgi:tetratricopeptide (TPR) repeat protein
MRCLLTFSIIFATSTALAGPSVAIAPPVTDSGQEYAWVGQALASALALRIHKQPSLSAITLRQVNAAMRHDGITYEELVDARKAIALGKQLGADIMVTGSYSATWPDISLVLKVFDPQKSKLVSTQEITGGLENLPELEARAARSLATALGAKSPDVSLGAFGTENLRAWRLTTLALDILNWQSLSPRAAHPKVPLRLPAAAIQKARGYLEDATRYDSDYGEAWAALGVAQALVGETSAAWRSFGKATALGFGHHPTATLGASFVRMREGKQKEAENILVSAIKRHPGFLHARGYLGELYLQQQRYADALKVFDDYAALVPNQPWVLAQRGYTKSKLKDFAGAIADSTAAVDMLPKSAYLQLELASRYIDAEKLFGAEEALGKAVEMHPSGSLAYVRLGYVYLLQGKNDLVVSATKKALANASFGKRRRDKAYAHLNLAQAYGRKGKLDDAFEHLEQAKKTGARMSFKSLKSDPALASMRKDPRFQKLTQ